MSKTDDKDKRSTNASVSGNTVCTTIHDMLSGIGVFLYHLTPKSERVLERFEVFGGVVGANSPDVVVSS